MPTPKSLACLSRVALVAMLPGLYSLTAEAAVLSDFAYYEASQDWNVYISGDVIGYSLSGPDQTDIEGAAAIGGSLGDAGDPLPSLTIGAALANDPAFDGTQTTLVVQNNLYNRNNQIHGSVWVGGNASLGGGPLYSGGFSVTGNLTVGGDLDFNASASGGQIGQLVDSKGLPASTLVGGNATFGDGSNVFGDLMANGDLTVNGNGMGDTDTLSAGGTFLHSNATPYLNAIASSGVSPIALPAAPIDFSTMTPGLAADSLAMSQVSSNASWQINDATRFGTILNADSTTAAAGDMIVFDLGSDPTVLWQDGFFLDASSDQDILINIGGLSHSLTNFAFTLSPMVSLNNVIFNFYEATELYLGDMGNLSGIGFDGNILAPYADVFFYNGLLRGNLAAASLTGNGQINWMQDATKSVPGPTSGVLLVFALAGLGIVGIRRRNA